MTVTATMVKSLREATGLGMMECKKALVECDGDMDKAKDLLRVKGGARADKVAGRRATEGRIAFAASGGGAALVEISCETDFVARDDNIAAFANSTAQTAAQEAAAGRNVDAAALAGLSPADGGTSLEDMRKNMVMKLGENIGINRVLTLNAAALSGDGVACYVHNGDKMAAAAVYKGDENLAREICMHIVAMRPRYVDINAVPTAVLDKEKEIYTAQAMETGKPQDIAAKIAAGKMKKFTEDLTLLPQAFAKDPDKRVGDVLAQAKTSILAFELLIVGEAADDAAA